MREINKITLNNKPPVFRTRREALKALMQGYRVGYHLSKPDDYLWMVHSGDVYDEEDNVHPHFFSIKLEGHYSRSMVPLPQELVVPMLEAGCVLTYPGDNVALLVVDDELFLKHDKSPDFLKTTPFNEQELKKFGFSMHGFVAYYNDLVFIAREELNTPPDEEMLDPVSALLRIQERIK